MKWVANKGLKALWSRPRRPRRQKGRSGAFSAVWTAYRQLLVEKSPYSRVTARFSPRVRKGREAENELVIGRLGAAGVLAAHC